MEVQGSKEEKGGRGEEKGGGFVVVCSFLSYLVRYPARPNFCLRRHQTLRGKALI